MLTYFFLLAHRLTSQLEQVSHAQLNVPSSSNFTSVILQASIYNLLCWPHCLPRLCTCHQCAASLWLAHGSMCDTEDLSLLPVAPSPVSLDFVKLHSCCPHPRVTASRLTPCWYSHVCQTSHVAGGKSSKTIADVFTWLVFPLLYSNSTVFPIGKAAKLWPMQIQSCRHTHSLRTMAEEPTTELSHCKTKPLYISTCTSMPSFHGGHVYRKNSCHYCCYLDISDEGELIVSRYVAESINQLIAGRFGHVGLRQLHTKLRNCSVRQVFV